VGSHRSREQDDLAAGVVLFQLGEHVSDPAEGVGRGDRDLDGRGCKELCDLGEDFGGGGGRAAVGLGPQLSCLVEGDDGLDALRGDAQVSSELDVPGAEEVDERVDSVGCLSGQTFAQPLAVVDRSCAVRAQPGVVGR